MFLPLVMPNVTSIANRAKLETRYDDTAGNLSSFECNTLDSACRLIAFDVRAPLTALERWPQNSGRGTQRNSERCFRICGSSRATSDDQLAHPSDDSFRLVEHVGSFVQGGHGDELVLDQGTRELDVLRAASNEFDTTRSCGSRHRA